MNTLATTIEQSKHLLELGLDPNTADMYYTGHRCILHNPKEIEYTQEPRVRTKFVSFDRLEVFFPAWSLSALLGVMPKMEADSTVWLGCVSTLIRCKSHDFMWQHDSTAAQPIDAAYEMVCYLLGQGLIKKGENDDI